MLLREAHAQVNADGGHAELSAHYHRYALDFYLLALTVARRTDDEAATTDRLEETAGRLATYLPRDLPTIADGCPRSAMTTAVRCSRYADGDRRTRSILWALPRPCSAVRNSR